MFETFADGDFLTGLVLTTFGSSLTSVFTKSSSDSALTTALFSDTVLSHKSPGLNILFIFSSSLNAAFMLCLTLKKIEHKIIF